MPENSLSHETSPYLLQHKDNPVHWFSWCSNAFDTAARENKPILLSIGYAACHWCHVIAHESFEDDATADVMNRLFINIKVDREERPDIDKIYMDAIHSLGEQGGWPLTIFMTPDAEPFWGGTYFPKTPQYGRPGFTQVLNEISRIWNEEPGKIQTNTTAIRQALQRNTDQASTGQLSQAQLSQAAGMIVGATDNQHGGLRGAPKFPQTSTFAFLWQMYCRNGGKQLRQAVELTLTNICQGGIYDHLAGGIARYSVDQYWLAPHFEKMLYDNAQLVELLANVWSRTQNRLFRIRIEETVQWLLRDMATPEGAFAASYDADSDGEEGKFYVWSKSEIEQVLSTTESARFCNTYDITNQGNWEGTNIPNRLKTQELHDEKTEERLHASRVKLLDARSTRTHPGWDDKLLADWNGLAIRALATAGMILQRPDWIEAGKLALTAILDLLWKDGALQQTHRAGKSQHFATADGYANLISASLKLYQATGEAQFVQTARDLTKALVNNHWNENKGGLYFSSSQAKNLIVRSHYAHDDATPNANAIMLQAFTDLHLLTDQGKYRDYAEQLHSAFAEQVAKSPMAHTAFLTAFDHLSDPVQAVFTGTANNPQVAALRREVLALAPPTVLFIYITDETDLPSAHSARSQIVKNDSVSLYLCKGQTCMPPVNDPRQVSGIF